MNKHVALHSKRQVCIQGFNTGEEKEKSLDWKKEWYLKKKNIVEF